MRYFQRQRIDFIQMQLQRIGHINRVDLMNQFQVSLPTASNDFQTYLRFRRKLRLPRMTYNATTKRYEISPPAQSKMEDENG